MFPIFLKALSIFLMIFAGYLVRRQKLVDETFNRQLSLLLVNLFYPALILSSMVRNFTLASLASNWTLPAGTALIMGCGWVAGRLARSCLGGESESLRRSFHFGCTINNYTFLPIMLVAGLLGERAVAQVVFASLGAELAVWTLGVQALTGQGISRRSFRNLLTVPMGALLLSVALLVARHLLGRAGVHAVDVPGPTRLGADMFLNTCQMIGQATIPVSAVICGSRMATLGVGHLFSAPSLSIVGMRLILIPAAAIASLWFLPLDPLVKQVLIVIAVQPCPMASVTMAEIYKSDAHFSAAAVLTTHVACMVTIPIWIHFLFKCL